jgi:hypothetical protein
METASATRTFVRGYELGTDSKPASTLFKGRARKFYPQSFRVTRSRRSPPPTFFMLGYWRLDLIAVESVVTRQEIGVQRSSVHVPNPRRSAL